MKKKKCVHDWRYLDTPLQESDNGENEKTLIEMALDALEDARKRLETAEKIIRERAPGVSELAKEGDDDKQI